MKTLLTIIATTLLALTANAQVDPLKITLNWTDNADNEVGTSIERSIEAGDFVEIGRVLEDIESYVDLDIEIGVTYTYRVRAYNSYGSSGYSNDAIGYTDYSNTATHTVVDPKYFEPFEPGENPGGLGSQQLVDGNVVSISAEAPLSN